MKLRSRGLGRRELLMDFREYDIARDGDEVVVSGTIREPVNWDFTIRFSGDDIPGMLRVGLHRHTLSLAARWILHMRSKPPAVPVVPAAVAPAAAPVPIARAPRSPRPVPVEREKPASPKPASITHLRPPAADSPTVSTAARTPDFGIPRRRGVVPVEPAEMEMERVVAQGGGR
ncbi:MAG TPA: hypothetical protein VNF71_12740 [Acidimicrobiales bacterium]|nr:hypothetical protein [Acidimicrobiales bacterium]